MRHFFCWLVGLFFSLISFSQSAKPVKYFEGVIEFEIKSESRMQGVSDNEIRERTGSLLRFYFKNGDYLREYVDGAGYTLRKIYYKKDDNTIYDYNPVNNPDTIYYLAADKPLANGFDISPGQKETILGTECASAVITLKYFTPSSPDTTNMTATYFFSPELPVDPAWHKNIYIWNDVISIHRSIAIKFIEDPVVFRQTFTATKITWQPLPGDVFKIDPALVKKEMPGF